MNENADGIDALPKMGTKEIKITEEWNRVRASPVTGKESKQYIELETC